jgi:hypothetical protein
VDDRRFEFEQLARMLGQGSPSQNLRLAAGLFDEGRHLIAQSIAAWVASSLAGTGDPLLAIREAWAAYQRGYLSQQEFEGVVAERVEVNRG